jgi:hypothetical protein
MYGVPETPLYFQCSGLAGTKENDFEVQLSTNTALNNKLKDGVVFQRLDRVKRQEWHHGDILVRFEVLGWHRVSAVHQLFSSGLRKGEIHLLERMDGSSEEKTPVGNVV